MKCKGCGASFDEKTDSICPYCGTPVPEEIIRLQAEAEEREQKKREAKQRELERQKRKEEERQIELKIAAAKIAEEGLSVFSWIGGVIWVIIGFCLGVLPGIGVIWLLCAAHDEAGFARNFLRCLNVILFVVVALVIVAAFSQ